MKHYPVIIEKDIDTGLLVGYIPNVAGAHSQARTLEGLRENLREAFDMLREAGLLEEQSELVAIKQMIA